MLHATEQPLFRTREWSSLFVRHLCRKNASNAACSFDKHGLILIIFGKQHQHTFKNDVL